jgi:putative membrane protein
MRLFIWTLKALVFFTLFAFALNNQHPASVKWFFGVEWQAPMVFVVLAAFGAGCALGVLAMAPGRWRRRSPVGSSTRPGRSPSAGTPPDSGQAAPPRDGL